MLHFISPNRNELKVLAERLNIPVAEDMNLATVRNVAEQLAEHIPVIITTLGAQGVLVRIPIVSDSFILNQRMTVSTFRQLSISQVTRKALPDQPFYDERGELIADSPVASRLYPAVDGAESTGKILSVSGCGDCLTAGVIYGIHKNLDEIGCVSVALKAAALSLRSFNAVPRTLRDALRR